MRQAAALPRTGFKIVLTVRDGPDVGASFQLLPPRVTIGRGGSNNIALNDQRVSRQAAVIEFTTEQIVITDLSGRESLMINGYTMKEASLTDGDLIRIGETELKFIVEALPLSPPLSSPLSPSAGMPVGQTKTNIIRHDFGSPVAAHPAAGPVSNLGPSNYDAGFGSPTPQSERLAADERAGKIRFYVIVGVVVLIVAYVLSGETITGKKDQGLLTVEQIEKNIKDSETRQQAIEKRRFKNEEERTRFVEAQRHYLTGFRDYQKGQWGRAIRSFETAQAIDSKNELAGRYKRLAEKKRDEMINMLTLEGRQYREKSMYARCSAAFEKVLDESPNKQDVKYKAAEALKKECDLLADERFQ